MTFQNLKDFPDFIFESDGYGDKKFFTVKEGDTYNFLFKLDSIEESEVRAYNLSIGKYSKYELPTGAKNSFAVLGLEEIPLDTLEECVAEKKSPSTRIREAELTDGELDRVLKIMKTAYSKYLEANPKVIRIYDEVQTTIVTRGYMEKIKNLIGELLGPNWSVQEGSDDQILLLSR
jgi:hypothetical protein